VPENWIYYAVGGVLAIVIVVGGILRRRARKKPQASETYPLW
jgi:hypothetical protein